MAWPAMYGQVGTIRRAAMPVRPLQNRGKQSGMTTADDMRILPGRITLLMSHILVDEGGGAAEDSLSGRRASRAETVQSVSEQPQAPAQAPAHHCRGAVRCKAVFLQSCGAVWGAGRRGLSCPGPSPPIGCNQLGSYGDGRLKAPPQAR